MDRTELNWTELDQDDVVLNITIWCVSFGLALRVTINTLQIIINSHLYIF